jgi:hypothetical protein
MGIFLKHTRHAYNFLISHNYSSDWLEALGAELTVGAFAQRPNLPKMLNSKSILETLLRDYQKINYPIVGWATRAPS